MRLWKAVPLLALAACAPEAPAIEYGIRDAEKGAEFRFKVVRVLDWLEPRCPISTSREKLSRLDGARSRLANLEFRLRDSKHGIDFTIARSDYFAQMPTAECAVPDLPGTDVQLEMAAEESMQLIQELEELAAVSSGKGGPS